LIRSARYFNYTLKLDSVRMKKAFAEHEKVVGRAT
jgi:hypothetical protein